MFVVNRFASQAISRLAAAALALGATVVPLHADAPATQPATIVSSPEQPAKIEELRARFGPLVRQRIRLLGDGSVLRDASKHAELRQKLLSLNPQIDALQAQIESMLPPSTQVSPSPQKTIHLKDAGRLFVQSVLVATEDPDTIAQAQAQIASNDPTTAAMGHLSLLQGRWMSAPDDATRQKATDAIIAFLKTADRNDSDLDLAIAATFFSNPQVASDAPLRDAIVATDPGPYVLRAAKSAKRLHESPVILAALVNKPIVLAGTTSGGKPFSTADWKGKVVLVDFWATWCGPCKASLPFVKETFQKYHDQGLEIVGVSNDYTKDALTKFLAADPAMAWPDLFDQKAADAHEWHPLTKQFGVVGIPQMFLIDKNGICRTVEARTDMDEMIPKLLSENPVAVVN